jgi:hypothetical protein
MTSKARAASSADADVAIEDDERHIDQVDDFISRNSDVLNESIRRSRSEVAAGRSSRKSISKMIAEGNARFSKKGERREAIA